MIELTVHGDPAACGAASDALDRVCSHVGEALGDLSRTSAMSLPAWHGPAGEAFRDKVVSVRADMAELHDRTTKAGRALSDFAGELSAVKAKMETARAVAVSAGLTVSGDTIQPPGQPAGDMPPTASDTHHASVAAYDEALALAEDARRLEDRAHTALQDTLQAVADDGFLQNLLEKLGFLPPDGAGAFAGSLWGGGRGAFGLGATSEWMTRSRHGRFMPRVNGRFTEVRSVHEDLWRRMRPSNWGAKPYHATSYHGWAKVGKASGIAGGVLVSGIAGLEQWEEDADDPGLNTSERVGRAGTVAGLTGGSAWAGAWAGTQVGSALGSFGGPVGTVAGAAVGGLVGGVAGSELGRATGDFLADEGGSAVDAITFWD